MGGFNNPLPSWTPPNSASGPQNNNVIQYGQALGQSLGADPMTGTMGPFNPAGGTIATQQSGQSLQGWLNTITGQSAPAASPSTSTPAPATGAPSFLQQVGNAAQAATTLANIAANPGRIVAIVLGLLFITMGLAGLALSGAESALEGHARVTRVASRVAAVVA